MSNIEALLDLGALAAGGLGGIGTAPGKFAPKRKVLMAYEMPPVYDGTPQHQHALLRTDRNSGWTCDACRASGNGRSRYRCGSGCDWDMCGSCWEQKSTEQAERSVSSSISFSLF